MKRMIVVAVAFAVYWFSLRSGYGTRGLTD